MRIDYNQLFFRDTNYVEFICVDTGKKYNGYIAGVLTQTFSGITYELGINWADWKDIYDNLKYEEAPRVQKNDLLPTSVKTAKCPVTISLSTNTYGREDVPGFVSNFHVDDDMTVGSGWFDCLLHEGVVDEEEWEGLKALQISINWDGVKTIDKKCYNNKMTNFNIFEHIDLD